MTSPFKYAPLYPRMWATTGEKCGYGDEATARLDAERRR